MKSIEEEMPLLKQLLSLISITSALPARSYCMT